MPRENGNPAIYPNVGVGKINVAVFVFTLCLKWKENCNIMHGVATCLYFGFCGCWVAVGKRDGGGIDFEWEEDGDAYV